LLEKIPGASLIAEEAEGLGTIVHFETLALKESPTKIEVLTGCCWEPGVKKTNLVKDVAAKGYVT
jgi:hypothetical protein